MEVQLVTDIQESIPYTMGKEYAPRYFLRDVRFPVSGAIIRRHRSMGSSSCGIRKNVRGAGSVLQLVQAELFPWMVTNR